MIRLNHCVHCYPDTGDVTWEIALFYNGIHHYRCSVCKTWYACHRDGRVYCCLTLME